MNNKLFARIMTAVICICMMSTVVFAAPALEAGTDETTKVINFMDGTTNIIKPVVAEGETAPEYVTMMAFCVAGDGTEYVDEETTPMIAIDQVAYASVWENVAVLASKIEDAKTAGMDKIVVKTGDSNEGGSTWVVEQDEETGAVNITVEYELNGGTLAQDVTNPATFDAATTIAAFFAGVTDPSKAATESATYTFEGWYTDTALTNKVTETSTELMTTLLASEEDTSITFYAKYDETPIVATINLVVGDVNLDGTVDGDDSTYLRMYTAINARENATNNAKREQLKTDLAALGYDIHAREEYTLADGSGTFVVGDVNLDGTVDGDDSTYLRMYTAINARENATNNAKREQLKTDLAALGYSIHARESYTVNEK